MTRLVVTVENVYHQILLLVKRENAGNEYMIYGLLFKIYKLIKIELTLYFYLKVRIN
jgi:hypothetical protein